MKKEIKNQLLEWFGWIGVVLILGGYCLLATGVISGNSWPYHVLVLIGSTAVAGVSYKRRAFQPLVLNAMFALLAIVALIRLALI